MTLPTIGHSLSDGKITDITPQQSYIAKSNQAFKARTTTVGASKSLYSQLSGLMNRLLEEITDKRSPQAQRPISLGQKDKTLDALEVNGIADRLPREQDYWYEQPNRDLILLGQHSDYSSLVKSITLGDETYPVSDENGQVVARHLNFGDMRFVSGHLNLADGSAIPLNISVITAL